MASTDTNTFVVKAYWTAILIIVASIGLGACTSPRKSPVDSSRFRVALLTPGPVSDAGWNAAAFDGLQLIKDKLDAETAMVQTRSPADFEDGFRDFASRGFNLIFAHGYEYTDSAISVARDFPKVYFVVSSGSQSSRNVASLTFKFDQAAYAEGVLAGGVTKTGVVGAIGGIELPSIRLTFEGFKRGFLSVRPKGRLLVSYIGKFDDVGAAKEAALAQISQGADLIVHDADAAGLGVFQAAAQAHVSDTFAGRPRQGEAFDFAVGGWRQAATGAPCLRGAVAVFDCALWSAHEAGSHTIFIGRVLAVGASEAAPLLYTGRRYGRPMLLDA